MKHELSLFENSVDSLNESLELYLSAEDKGVRRYKFAVLNICHFVELLFKYLAWKTEPEKIFYQTKRGENKTIGLWDCIDILQSQKCGIDEGLICDIRWIKKLRNDIEHYEFAFDIPELKLFSGKILSAILRYSEEQHDFELLWYVDDKLQRVIRDLCKSYDDRLSVALSIVKQQEDIDYAHCLSNGGMETYWRKYVCPSCDQETLISDAESETGYKCMFCGNTESDELEYTCDSCSNIWNKSEMSYFDYTGEGHFRHMCPVCLRDPNYV